MSNNNNAIMWGQAGGYAAPLYVPDTHVFQEFGQTSGVNYNLYSAKNNWVLLAVYLDLLGWGGGGTGNLAFLDNGVMFTQFQWQNNINYMYPNYFYKSSGTGPLTVTYTGTNNSVPNATYIRCILSSGAT